MATLENTEHNITMRWIEETQGTEIAIRVQKIITNIGVEIRDLSAIKIEEIINTCRKPSQKRAEKKENERDMTPFNSQ